ncbi:MAG: hypothetical protein JW737_06775 [Acidobacteria bacterium]|nr:hypothetical protein [Acidobacteriota bacterium]
MNTSKSLLIASSVITIIGTLLPFFGDVFRSYSLFKFFSWEGYLLIFIEVVALVIVLYTKIMNPWFPYILSLVLFAWMIIYYFTNYALANNSVHKYVGIRIGFIVIALGIVLGIVGIMIPQDKKAQIEDK